MRKARFAIFGTGFWSRYQLAAWKELEGAECVALYNRTRSKAEALAEEFGVPAVYDDPEALLAGEKIDFADLIVDPSVHERFVRMAAERGLPVICQKPMAPSLEAAERMVETCRQAGVPLLIHENWRWQTAIRALKAALDRNPIGRPFCARIDYLSSIPVWQDQPFLKDLEEFILTDMGGHILDVARFLFGEAESLCCQTHHICKELAGEDFAKVMMRMRSGMTVTCEISYASITERERAAETYILVEGEGGSIELGPDFWLRTTTRECTQARRYPPPRYAWARRDAVHSSIVPCNADLLRGVTGAGASETTGEDNLRTMRLVFAAYDSARRNEVIRLD
ncbi:MAG: Gfo/Idh/MocA family oxidoreductase [Planctomycetes bacterium]|nr:Gfo/Idh/MocA family oxidoreductase [Planctomycetota bacterium]